MDKTPKIQEELFEKYWTHIEENMVSSDNISSFFHHYLVMKKNSTIKLSEVYIEFKRFVSDNKNMKMEDLLKDILKFSKIYAFFLFPWKDGKEYEKISKSLENIKELKMTVVYPYLLGVFGLYNNKNISEATLLKILSLLESYAIRRQITNKRTSGLNKVFMSLAKEIGNLKGFNYENYSEYFSYVLINKKGSAEFPSDNEFKQSFVSRNMYALKNIDFILKKLEDFDNKETVISDLTIEHIMPQTLTAVWKEELGDDYQIVFDSLLHTIGNLTLTGYNSELSNDAFCDKKKHLQDNSKLKLNSFIVMQDVWTREEIMKRAELLFDEIAIKVWKFPTVNIDIEASFQETYSIADSNDVTKRELLNFNFYETEEVSIWRDFLERFLLQISKYDEDKFQSLFFKNIDKKILKIVSSDKTNMRVPKEIKQGIYIETNASASTLINNINFIYNYLDYDRGDSEESPELVYTIKAKKSKNVVLPHNDRATPELDKQSNDFGICQMCKQRPATELRPDTWSNDPFGIRNGGIPMCDECSSNIMF